MATKKPHEKESSDDPECIRYRLDVGNRRAEGYCAYGYSQIHHILPCTTVSDATISQQVSNEQFEVLQNCFQVTNWNVNDQANCVGLPIKSAYYESTAPKGWEPWPCHLVDHPTYNGEVKGYLLEQIWDPICAAAEECEFDATSVEADLSDATTYWKGELEDRGGRVKGSGYHWKHRLELGDAWYVPFSMAANPAPRSAPKDLSGALKKYLQDLFKKVGCAA